MSLLETLRSWQPPNLLDLLLISVLMHRLLVLFRGTATLHVTAALALLWLLQGAAVELNLVLTSRFLEWLGTAAVLLIVVAFRDEIREVLLQTSPLRLIWGRPQPQSASSRLLDVTAAVARMAEAHVGALVVFQNRDRLGELARDGLIVGARLSGPLIEALFTKESPVHDGALIVRGDRIDRVGTILPLTRRPDVPAQYGTRHRAAIGLSEQSDAVILVVSEERGEVSVVHRGQVLVAGTAEETARLLRRLLRWEDDEASRLRALRREALRQAVGFGLTVLLVLGYWTVFFGRQSSVTSLDVPLEFRNTPPGLELDGISAERVEVQVRGQRPLIEDLKARPNQIGAIVDLKGLRAGGRQTAPLGAENIERPVGLTILRIVPPSVSFDLEQLAEREVPVVVRFDGPTPAGLQIAVSPRTVRLIGPATVLGRIESIGTEPLPTAGLDASPPVPPRSVSLAPFDGRLRLAEGQGRSVRVTLGRAAPAAPSAPEPAGEVPQPEERQGQPEQQQQGRDGGGLDQPGQGAEPRRPDLGEDLDVGLQVHQPVPAGGCNGVGVRLDAEQRGGPRLAAARHQHGLQGLGGRLAAGVPILGPPGEEPIDDHTQARRQVDQVAQGDGLAAEPLAQALQGRVAGEGVATRDHLVHQATQAEQVAAAVDLAAAGLFG